MLVDSNILIYAINKDSPKYKTAIKFLEKNKFDLVFAHQNIIEAIKVLTQQKYSHPITPQLATNAVLLIANASRIISPNNITYPIVLDYIKKFKLSGNRIFDAYLAATAISNGIYEIATDNSKDFKKFTELKILNPFVR